MVRPNAILLAIGSASGCRPFPTSTGRDKRQRPETPRRLGVSAPSRRFMTLRNELTAPSGRDIVPELPMTTISPSMDSTRQEVATVIDPKPGIDDGKALSHVEPTTTGSVGRARDLFSCSQPIVLCQQGPSLSSLKWPRGGTHASRIACCTGRLRHSGALLGYGCGGPERGRRATVRLVHRRRRRNQPGIGDRTDRLQPRSALLSHGCLLRREPAARIPRLPLGLRPRLGRQRDVRCLGRIRSRAGTPGAVVRTAQERRRPDVPQRHHLRRNSTRGSARQHRHVEHHLVYRRRHGPHARGLRVLSLPGRGVRVLPLRGRRRWPGVRRHPRRPLLGRVLRHVRRRRCLRSTPVVLQRAPRRTTSPARCRPRTRTPASTSA